jgi:hypothetical protein
MRKLKRKGSAPLSGRFVDQFLRSTPDSEPYIGEPNIAFFPEERTPASAFSILF